MRKILFRGKRLSNNNWVYGIPVPIEINCAKTGHIEMIKCHSYDELDCYHLLSEDEEVDLSTINQSTGFKEIKVIGNIYDNLELLEEQNEN